MQGFATVNMAGNLTADPEIRYRPSDGEPVASFTVAVNRIVKSEFQKNKWTDYIDCMKSGDEAEELAVNFKKGDAVEICGRLVQQRWEERGYKKSRMVVDVAVISMVVRAEDVKEPECV